MSSEPQLSNPYQRKWVAFHWGLILVVAGLVCLYLGMQFIWEWQDLVIALRTEGIIDACTYQEDSGILALRKDRTLELWDLKQRKKLLTRHYDDPIGRPIASKDGSFVLKVGLEQVDVWRQNGEQWLVLSKKLNDWVYDVAVDNGHGVLAVVVYRQELRKSDLRFFSLKDGAELRTLLGTDVKRVRFGPSGLMATVEMKGDEKGMFNCTVSIWQDYLAAEPKRVWKYDTVPSQSCPIDNASFSTDEQLLAVTDDGWKVTVWDVNAGAVVATRSFLPIDTAICTLYGPIMRNDLRFCRGNTVLVIGPYKWGHVVFWDFSNDRYRVWHPGRILPRVEDLTIAEKEGMLIVCMGNYVKCLDLTKILQRWGW